MARSFFITRASASSEDPTALEFFPPKGSDELYEALKEAFPFEANLAARMRAAVIEFLLQEQQADQLTPVSTEYLPSPQSTFISSTTMPSPAIGASQEPSPSRRQSAATGQEALMDVWSLPNKPQAKIHTRRTMTSEEKKAYKQKRLIGACADCKRRRRKCEHNNSAGGSSIVPQKVGKHKKRVTATETTCKTDAAVDFSWAAPAFNFDDAMAIEPEIFDFNATEFNFSPDLTDDWQLFPDLPMANANNNYTDSFYDASIYSPRATLSQQRVSTGSDGANVLDQNMFNQGAYEGGESFAGASGTDAFGTTSSGNLSMSPVTPVSLSPISRTQSASGDLYGQTNYNFASSHIDFNSLTTGAHLDQTRVSRDKPIQVPLPTPDSLSPMSRSQSLNDSSAGSLTQACPFAATTFRSDHSSDSLHLSSDLALHDTTDQNTSHTWDRRRLRIAPNHDHAIQHNMTNSRDQETSLVIQELLQSRSTSQPSSSTPASRTRKQQASTVAQPAFLEETSAAKDTSLPMQASPTTMKKSPFSLPAPNAAAVFSSTTTSAAENTRAVSTTSRPSFRIATITDSVSSHERSLPDRLLQSQSQNRLLANVGLQNKTQAVARGHSTDQAPISFVLCAAYCGIVLVQSSGVLAVISTVLLTGVILGFRAQDFEGAKASLSSSKSSILQLWTSSMGTSGNTAMQIHPSRAIACRPAGRSSWTKPLSSHLGLLRATAIV